MCWCECRSLGSSSPCVPPFSFFLASFVYVSFFLSFSLSLFLSFSLSLFLSFSVQGPRPSLFVPESAFDVLIAHLILFLSPFLSTCLSPLCYPLLLFVLHFLLFFLFQGPRPSLFVPESAFDVLVRVQIARLEAPALQCVDLVQEELLRIALACESPV